MARGITNVLQVIVLATGTHTTLAAGGPLVAALFPAKEYILELHHAGIHKQQGWIVNRHQ